MIALRHVYGELRSLGGLRTSPIQCVRLAEPRST
jgi:hypothetical protein